MEAQLSVSAYVSISSPAEVIIDLVSNVLQPSGTLVLLNGDILGLGDDRVINITSARRKPK